MCAFSYVASKSNVADLPSRGALEEMARSLRELQPSFSLEDAAVAVRLPAVDGDWAERARGLLQAGARKRSRSEA